MKQLLGLAVCVLILGSLVQGPAPAQVTLDWTDARGAHSLALDVWFNPDYTGDQYSLEKRFMWRGILDDDTNPAYDPMADFKVVMNDFSSIDFTCSGVFYGMSPTGDYDLWQEVYLYQHVKNETSATWTQFDLELADLAADPNPTKNASFYNTREWSPASWDVYQDTQIQEYTQNVPTSVVPVGGEFYDLAKIAADVNWSTGDGGFVLTKYATPGEYVPEPGSMIALLGGLGGLLAYVKRRKI